ncbi:helix-turn-helix domain-containing protein [Enterococcus sp. DIV0187]|uniref:helix-turn-helix domain-containing protein n=1 Tax=Enterococcus sp. DIV0187 TaxID=2774644 RepID=UPI003F25CF1F
MPNYLEIVRLHELAMSQRSISQMLGTSRNTVSKVIKIITVNQLSYYELAKWGPQKVDALFKQPKSTKQRQPYFTLPNYEQLTKELAKK